MAEATGLPYPCMDWDSSNLPDSWVKFARHCKLMFEGPLKGKSPKEQCAYILLWVGDRGRNIHDSWNLTDEENRNTKLLMDKFRDFVQPKANPVFARFKFYNEAQGNDSIDEFVARLSLSAKSCDFGDSTDEMIRDRIVFGCRSERVREKLIEKGRELTLDLAKQIAQSDEYNRKQINAMKMQDGEVDWVSSRDKRQSRRPKTSHIDRSGKYRGTKPKVKGLNELCKRCGYKTHNDKKDCPALGQTCNKCGKPNHYAKMCKTNSDRKVHVVNKTKTVSDSDSSCEDEFYVHTVSGFSKSRSDQALIKLKLVDKCIDAKIDTGSQVNILPSKLFEQLNHDDPFLPTDARLTSYSGNQLNVLGKTKIRCSYKNRLVDTDFYIVDQKNVPALINLRTAQKLGLIKLTYAISQQSPSPADKILSEYSDLFKGIGTFAGKCSIKLKENASPVVCATRKVPHALRNKLRSELDSMEEKGVIAKITDPTEWVNALVCVEKPNGNLRICIDPKALNDCIQRPYYPMRTIDDVTAKLAGATHFSVLDATKGYYSCQLTDESSRLTTFATPFGRYRYLRLPMGLKSSQDIYNRKMDEILEGLDGIACIVDDLIIFGKSKTEHDKNLTNLLIRAREKGLKFNPDKVCICQSEVNYFGHVITNKGLSVDEAKVSAILNMQTPNSRHELETLLGMLTYLSKFAPNLAELTSPLRALLKKDIEFIWGPEQDKAFAEVKKVITQAPVLKYFDPAKPVTLQVDASSKGIGAVCLQDGKPISYASKSLTVSQISWAQIEKELLAILFGCIKFKQYIYGKHTIVESDCKPIISIMKKPLCIAPPRLQRMLLQLQPYDIEVIHKKGTNILFGDALSRNFVSETHQELFDGLDAHVHMVLQQLPVSDQRLKEIQKETEADEQIQSLVITMKNGWPSERQKCKKSIVEFWNHRDELSFENGIMFKGQKIVIPTALRTEMIRIIHDSSHQGCNQATRRARDVMFWPGMSNAITEFVLACPLCERYRHANTKEPLKPHEVPQRPWQHVSCDIFAFDNHQYLITVDAFSRYFEIDLLSDMKSTTVIRKLKVHFSRFGVVERLKTDNGTQFTSEQFRDFAKDWQFTHVTSSPNHQSSNGLSEIYVKLAKRILRKAKDANRDPYLPLLEHRNTPLQCGYSPAQLLMGRRLRSVVPTTNDQLTPKPVNIKKAREKMQIQQDKSKYYHDRNARTLRTLSVGDRVMFQKKPGDNWERAKVIEKFNDRSFEIQTPDGATYRRNRVFINNSKSNYQTNLQTNNKKCNPIGTPLSPVNSSINVNANQPYVTRSGREVKPLTTLSKHEWEM